jgi:hypothetical protein
MICYRDMTFCAHAKPGCHRALTNEVHEAAAKWWGSEDAPIAVMDCKGDCRSATHEPAGDQS